MKSGDIMKDMRSKMIRKDKSFQFEGPTIVYCQTKKACEEVLDVLKSTGIDIIAFLRVLFSVLVRYAVHFKRHMQHATKSSFTPNSPICFPFFVVLLPFLSSLGTILRNVAVVNRSLDQVLKTKTI